MKTWVKTSALGLTAAIILCLAARAQLSSLIQGTLTPAPDSIVQITADAMGLEAVALEDLPRGGTYWWVYSSGVTAPVPFPPMDRVVPIYAITAGQFLVDVTEGQVAERALRWNTTQSRSSSLTVSAVDRLGNAVADLIEQIQQTQFERSMMMSLGVPSPGEGGGGTNGGDFGNYSTYTIDTNLLWLEITNVSNGWSHLNLHSGTNPFTTSQVFAILTKTNLLDATWNIETTIRPTEYETSVMPFTMQNSGRYILFFRAQDWTGVDSDSDGIPDWWAWQYFGTTNVAATNLDNYFRPLLYDYQHGQDPNQMGFSQVLAWGDNSYGQCDFPLNLTNAVAVAANGDAYLSLMMGYEYIGGVFTFWPYIIATPTSGFSLALKADGGMVAWGDGRYGQTNIPGNLTNIMAIAAGGCHGLALDFSGNVHAWGSWNSAFVFTNTVVSNTAVVPGGISNVVAIAAGRNHDVALRADGQVLSWGYLTNAAWVVVPTNLPPAKAVAAGWNYSAALLTNGTVAIWAGSFSAPTSSIAWYVPASLTNAIAIAGGPRDLLVLKADGNIIDLPGDSEIDLGQITINVVSMANGYLPGLALDGSGTAWILGNSIATPNYPLSHLLSIAAGWNHALALRGGLLTPLIVGQPASRIVVAGTNLTLSVQALSNFTPSYQWQFNGVNLTGATNATLTLANVQPSDAGDYGCVVANDFGAVISSNAVVAVVTPPVIISQAPLPTNQVATYQTNLTLSVVASAPGQSNGFPLHYQWQFNGTNVGGNTNNFTLFVDTSTLGNYSVVVTNAAGSATSLVWQVSVTYAGTYIDVGTLAYYLSTNTASKTNGISDIYNGTMLLSGWNYASYTGTNLAFLTNAVWSTNFWLKGVQGLSATCIGFSNGLGGQGLVTMVSPRHYLFASHMHPEGYLAAFLDTNNVIYWRTTVQRVDIPLSFTLGITNDISVGILNSDLPSSVGYLTVLPADYAKYLPTNNLSVVQGIGMNQDMRLFGQPMTFGDSVIYTDWNSGNSAPFGLPTNWNVTIRNGDSSDPEMILINNQLVLCSHNFWFQGGPIYGFATTAINQYMHYLSTNNAAGTDYQLSPFSLTNWPVINP